MPAMIIRALTILVLTFGALSGAAVTAFAHTDAASSPGDCVLTSTAERPPCLPMDRWIGNMPHHLRWSGNLLDVGSAANQITSQMNGIPLGIGNSAFSLTAWLSRLSGEGAESFTLPQGALLMVDSMLGGVSKALEASGITLLLIICSVLFAIWRGRRGGTKVALQTLVAVLALFVLMGGAAATTFNPETGQGQFGKGSPGWLISNTNKAVTDVLTTPVGTIKDLLQNVPASVSARMSGEQANMLNCSNYVQALHAAYQKRNGGKSSTLDTLSTSWEMSGLVTWQSVQFGDNKWASKVGCRLLELGSSAVSKDDHAAMTLRTANGTAIPTPSTGWDPAAIAFTAPLGNVTDSNPNADIALIGWAACRMDSTGAISAEKEWKDLAGDHQVSDETCQKLFTVKAEPWGTDTPSDDLKAFNYGSDLKSWQKDVEGHPEIAEFVASLHGAGQFGGGTQSLLYILSAWVNAFIYVPIQFAVMLTQWGLMMMGFALFASAFKGLLGNNLDSITSTGRASLSMMLFTFGAQLLLAVIVMLAGIIMAVGAQIANDNPLVRPIVVALAPLMAVIVVHFLFKKVLKAPSPLTLKGAGAWASGAASGGASGALSLLGLKELGDWAGNKSRQLSAGARRGVTNSFKSDRGPSGPGTAAAGKGGSVRPRKGDLASTFARSGAAAAGPPGVAGSKSNVQHPEDRWSADWTDLDNDMSLSDRATAREQDLKDAKQFEVQQAADQRAAELARLGAKPGRFDKFSQIVERGADRIRQGVSAAGDDRRGAAWFGHAAANAAQWAARPRNLVRVAGAAVAAPIAIAAAPLALTAAPALIAGAGVAGAVKFRKFQERRDAERTSNGGLTNREAGQLQRLQMFRSAQLAEHNQRERAVDAEYVETLRHDQGFKPRSDGGWVETKTGRVLPSRESRVTTDWKAAAETNSAKRAHSPVEQGRFEAELDMRGLREQEPTRRFEW